MAQEFIYGTLGLWANRGRPNVMQGMHQHQDLELNYIEKGSITYLVRGRRITIPSRRLAVFWAAIPHQLCALHPGTTMCWLTLPLSWFLQWKIAGPLAESLLHGQILVDEDKTGLDEILLPEWSRLVPYGKAEEESHRIVMLEVEARLRRLGRKLSRGAPPTVPDSARAIPKVEQMALHIAQNYLKPLRVDQVAAHAGLNANYASTVFKEAFGMTMTDYIVQHRLWHAQRLLATSGRKILDIALESGFGSLSRFYEAFEKAFNTSPRKFRARFARR